MFNDKPCWLQAECDESILGYHGSDPKTLSDRNSQRVCEKAEILVYPAYDWVRGELQLSRTSFAISSSLGPLDRPYDIPKYSHRIQQP